MLHRVYLTTNHKVRRSTSVLPLTPSSNTTRRRAIHLIILSIGVRKFTKGRDRSKIGLLLQAAKALFVV
jgi:hypothetical protein